MRVGMIAPITHPYPPPGYGPWERATHDLTEHLTAEGVDVTLFAPAGSMTRAHLVETIPEPLAHSAIDPRLAEQAHIARAMEMARDGWFDIIHSHLHVHSLVFSRLIHQPMVSTLHGAGWDGSNHALLRRYADMPFISLSDQERSFLPELNYVETIPHGIAVDDIDFGDGGGGYLAFVGRMAPEKAPDIAIEVARKSGLPLLMAGHVEPVHRDYFESVMKGLGRGIDYLGPLDRVEVNMLLSEAEALVMPLRWHEPFGLVVIEALAAGTPVVAWRMGAMPEIVRDRETGFLVADVTQAAEALDSLGETSRNRCRIEAETRFSAERMARDHLRVYARLLGQTIPESRSLTGIEANLIP